LDKIKPIIEFDTYQKTFKNKKTGKSYTGTYALAHLTYTFKAKKFRDTGKYVATGLRKVEITHFLSVLKQFIKGRKVQIQAKKGEESLLTATFNAKYIKSKNHTRGNVT